MICSPMRQSSAHVIILTEDGRHSGSVLLLLAHFVDETVSVLLILARFVDETVSVLLLLARFVDETVSVLLLLACFVDLCQQGCKTSGPEHGDVQCRGSVEFFDPWDFFSSPHYSHPYLCLWS